MELVWPSEEYLPGYIEALEQGWSPDNLRPEAALEQLDRIAQDRASFISEQVDREGKGPQITLPDGRAVPRLPGYHKWIWDGEFCGVIGFRWQPGTTDLPSYCLGHIGFSVIPSKRRLGYASRALELILPEARLVGLSFVELTTNADNFGSQRVITKNGGQLFEHFRKPESYGGAESLRFRIDLT